MWYSQLVLSIHLTSPSVACNSTWSTNFPSWDLWFALLTACTTRLGSVLVKPSPIWHGLRLTCGTICVSSLHWRSESTPQVYWAYIFIFVISFDLITNMLRLRQLRWLRRGSKMNDGRLLGTPCRFSFKYIVQTRSPSGKVKFHSLFLARRCLRTERHVVKPWIKLSKFFHQLTRQSEKRRDPCSRRRWLRFFTFWASYYPPLGRTRSRGRCWAAIRLSRQPEPPDYALHKEVDGLNSEGQLVNTVRSTVCSSARHSQAPEGEYPICVSMSGNVRHRKRLSRSNAVLGGWVPMPGRKVRSLVVFSNNSSAIHRWSTQSATRKLLSSDELMSCCSTGTNGWLDLKYRAFPPGE